MKIRIKIQNLEKHNCLKSILYQSFKCLILWTFSSLCLGEVVLLALATISKGN